MDYLPLLLQQEANKLYPNILNCAPTNPPHWPGRVSHSFFLKHRKGIGLDIDFWWDEVLDYIKYEWADLALVRDGTDLKLMKDWSATTLATQIYDAAKYHSFKYVSAVGWTNTESGTWANGSETSWTFFLTDSTKTWTVNAYAWQRVYCYAGDWWVWQTFKVIANTDKILTLETWYDTVPTNVSYKIFDTWTEVPAFVWGDWIYIVHNETNIIKVDWFWEVIDCEFNVWRLFALDVNYNVLTSAVSTNDGAASMWWGYFAFYVNASSILWTSLNSFRMVTFKDSVLLLSSTDIKLVKELSVEISWTTILSYVINTITSFVGAHSASAVRIFNQWLYMLSSNNKLVAVSIQEVWTNKYEVKLEDMWTNIQQWIDSVSSWDIISIDMTDNEIILVRRDVARSESTIFKFDQYFQFRYRRETALDIRRVKVYITPYYLWDMTYVYNEDLELDHWAEDFIQSIKLFVWEEDIFSLKQYISHKIYLWKNTSVNTEIKYKSYIDGKTYDVVIPLSSVEYLIDATAYNTNSAMWWTILWFGMYWWYSNNDFLSDLFISNINVIELPIAMTVSLMEIEMVWDFEMWGMLLWYNKIEPHITPIKSVVWYTE